MVASREITADVKLWNFADEALAERGVIPPEDVRAVGLERAIVDTGATRLVLTNEIVHKLGLTPASEITVRYADNQTARKPIVRGVTVEVMGRIGTFDAVVESNGQVLIGMEILEGLDLWPDPQRGVRTTNPESPDIPLYNLLREADA